MAVIYCRLRRGRIYRSFLRFDRRQRRHRRPVPGSCSGQAKDLPNEGLHLRRRSLFPAASAIARSSASSRPTAARRSWCWGHPQPARRRRLGEQRVAELVGKFGKRPTPSQLTDRLFDLSAKKMRAAMAEWVDGRFEVRRLRRRRQHRPQHAGAHPCGGGEKGDRDPCDFPVPPTRQGTRQCAPAVRQGSRGLCAHLTGRPAHLHQRRHHAQLSNRPYATARVLRPALSTAGQYLQPHSLPSGSAVRCALPCCAIARARMARRQPLRHPRRTYDVRRQDLCASRDSSAAVPERRHDGASGAPVNQATGIAAIEIIESHSTLVHRCVMIKNSGRTRRQVPPTASASGANISAYRTPRFSINSTKRIIAVRARPAAGTAPATSSSIPTAMSRASCRPATPTIR